ncbi:hypothetical protein HQ29_08105 [Porphyromonas canoris]|nr:hypothetical protein HQ29_08105 [Porphyromonas canoris]
MTKPIENRDKSSLIFSRGFYFFGKVHFVKRDFAEHFRDKTRRARRTEVYSRLIASPNLESNSVDEMACKGLDEAAMLY